MKFAACFEKFKEYLEKFVCSLRFFFEKDEDDSFIFSLILNLWNHYRYSSLFESLIYEEGVHFKTKVIIVCYNLPSFLALYIVLFFTIYVFVPVLPSIHIIELSKLSLLALVSLAFSIFRECWILQVPFPHRISQKNSDVSFCF